MSELIDKFECLRKLNEEYKRNIKLFYACNGLCFNVIILTNDDMFIRLEIKMVGDYVC